MPSINPMKMPSETKRTLGSGTLGGGIGAALIYIVGQFLSGSNVNAVQAEQISALQKECAEVKADLVESNKKFDESIKDAKEAISKNSNVLARVEALLEKTR